MFVKHKLSIYLRLGDCPISMLYMREPPPPPGYPGSITSL